MTFQHTIEHDTYPLYLDGSVYISTVSLNTFAFHDVTLADVQAAQQDGHIIVAWQVNINADAQAYATANGVQIITAAQLNDLWNALSARPPSRRAAACWSTTSTRTG